MCRIIKYTMSSSRKFALYLLSLELYGVYFNFIFYLYYCQWRGAKQNELTVESSFPYSYGISNNTLSRKLDFESMEYGTKFAHFWPNNRYLWRTGQVWPDPSTMLFERLFLRNANRYTIKKRSHKTRKQL